jgi:hypothetical protein
MKHLWTWSGRYFGYRENNELWSKSGKHVGKIYDDEVYSHEGKYLGEMLNGRLIRSHQKRFYCKYATTQYSQRAAYNSFVDYVGYVMYAGFEDFPLHK